MWLQIVSFLDEYALFGMIVNSLNSSLAGMVYDWLCHKDIAIGVLTTMSWDVNGPGPL